MEAKRRHWLRLNATSKKRTYLPFTKYFYDFVPLFLLLLGLFRGLLEH